MLANFEDIKNKFGLRNTSNYKFGHKNIYLKTDDEWKLYLSELVTFYDSIIAKITTDNIHIFPIAQIPLLISLGYLMQNDSPNVKVYQYIENESKWVYDESDDNIEIKEEFIDRSSDILALALQISSRINSEDIDQVIDKDYDLLSFKVDNPKLSYLNYKADVLRVKSIVKNKLDSIYNNYKEIHLFIAAPAGVCIEIGRIIRYSMYPDTFVYTYNNTDKVHYKQICNLKKLRDINL